LIPYEGTRYKTISANLYGWQWEDNNALYNLLSVRGVKLSQMSMSKKENIPEFKSSWVMVLNSAIQSSYAGSTSYKMGKILTLIDAIIIDKEQNKATKDIIKNIFWEHDFFESNIKANLIYEIEKNTGKVKMEDWEREEWERNKIGLLPSVG